MATWSERRLAEASKKFVAHASKADLTPNAYKLLLVLFRETIAKGKRDTGIVTNSEMHRIADLKRTSFDDAQRELKDTGWLVISPGEAKSKIRTLHIPGEAPLYDLANPKTPRHGLRKKRTYRKPQPQ